MDTVLAAEERFFRALTESDVDALEELLAEDFLIVDVMSGGLADKAMLLGAMRLEQLRFERVDPVAAETRVRIYGSTAVAIGRTEMSGRFGDAPFVAKSRYTHVYAEQDGRWQLVSAQGTPVVE